MPPASCRHFGVNGGGSVGSFIPKKKLFYTLLIFYSVTKMALGEPYNFEKIEPPQLLELTVSDKSFSSGVVSIMLLQNMLSLDPSQVFLLFLFDMFLGVVICNDGWNGCIQAALSIESCAFWRKISA